MKPTFARLFDNKIKEMMQGKGTPEEQASILKVCDRLCNFFLQNKLQETSTDAGGEKIKRSRISAPVSNTRDGIEVEIAETANLDNCF